MPGMNVHVAFQNGNFPDGNCQKTCISQATKNWVLAKYDNTIILIHFYDILMQIYLVTLINLLILSILPNFTGFKEGPCRIPCSPFSFWFVKISPVQTTSIV